MSSSEYHIHSGYTDFATFSTKFLFPFWLWEKYLEKVTGTKQVKWAREQNQPEEIDRWVELVCS